MLQFAQSAADTRSDDEADHAPDSLTDEGDLVARLALARATMDALTDPVLVLAPVGAASCPDDFRVSLANAAAAAALGTPRRRLVGRTLLDLAASPAERGSVEWCRHAWTRRAALHLEDVAVPGRHGGVDQHYEVHVVPVGPRLSFMWRDTTQARLSAAALSASEAAYRLLADNATDVVLRTGADGTIVFASPSLTEMLGWPVAEVLGRRVSDLMHPDDLTVVRQQQRRILDGGGHEGRVEARFARCDGGWRWMSDHGRALLDDTGALAGGIDALRDIEAEHAAVAALRGSERRFRDLAEHSLDVVVRLDSDLAIGWVSPSVERVLGWTAEEFAARAVSDMVHPEDLAAVTSTQAQAAASGSVERAELRMRRKDGRWEWMSGEGKVLTTAAGDVSTLVSLRSIATEVAAAGALRDARERLELVLESSELGLWDWNMQTGETVFNERWAQMLGYTLDELSPVTIDTWERLTHPEDLAHSAERIAAHDRGDTRFYELECRMRHRDGHWVWVRDRGRIVSRDASGRALRMTGTHEDITAIRTARQALASSEERYRLLAESIGDVVEEYDSTWHLVWASPSLRTVLGMDPATAVGAFALDLLHPDFVTAEFQRTVDDVIAQRGTRLVRRVRRKHADGDWRWVDSTLSFRYDGEGRLASVYITSRDVEAQVAAESALERNRQRFQRMFTNHGAVMLLVDPADGSVVDANTAAAEFYGYPAAELRRLRVSDLNVLDSDEVRRSYEKAAAEQCNSFVFPHRLADGTIRIVQVHSSPIDDGDRTLLFSIVSDITDDLAARDALTHSEEQFRELAETIGDVVITFDVAGRISWVSPSVRRTLGYEPHDLLGLRMADVADVDIDEEVLAPPRSEASSTRRVELPPERLQLGTADGDSRWVESRAVLRYDREGRYAGGLTSLRDVDAQVHAEEALRDSRRHYRALAENSGDVVLLLSADGCITWASPAVTRLSGWYPEQLLGRATFDLAHPDDLPHVQAGRLEVLDGGIASFEGRVRRADGGWQWIHVVSRAICDDAGTVTGIVTNWRDATEDVAAREALQASESRFRVAMAAAPHPMMLLDLDLRIVEANDAVTAMLGHDREHLLRLGLDDLTGDSALTVSRSTQGPVIDPEPINVSERPFRTRDGDWRWGQLSISLVRDETGQPSHYIAQLTDLTAIKHAQDELSWQATHDALTRLPNRAGFILALEQAQDRARRHDVPLAVLFCDLDGFKRVNDTHGHDAGDELLKGIARRLAESCRSTDTVARLGGDEFVVVAEHARVADEVTALADRILDRVREPFTLPDGDSVVSGVSIGIAITRHDESRRDILRRADTALYTAKAAGRGRWVLHRPDDATTG